MKECGCHITISTKEEKNILWIALILNASMFIVGSIGGLIAQSTGLIADGLDMLADSFAYIMALLAISRSMRFKANAAMFSGGLLFILGCGILIDVGRRAWLGSSPEGLFMIGIASISLVINIFVLKLLQRFKQSEVHLHTAWVFTRADVIANLGVIVSGIIVFFSNSHYPDLLIGAAISLYVIKEAFQIINSARNEQLRVD